MPPKRNKPMLNRVYLQYPDPIVAPDNMLQWERHMQDTYQSIRLSGDTPEFRTLKHALESPRVYFDAGTLPEVIITPPKDGAVYKTKQMIPNKELRDSFYKSLYNDKDDSGFDYPDTFDRRLYINRLYELYKKSQKPAIKNVQSKSFNAIPFLQKIGIMHGDSNRANYSPITNTLYIDPEHAVGDIEAELSHAYLMRGTDTPRSWNWMKLFLSVPNGDIKINGKDGYDRPGHYEFTAHKIIEPIFHDYLTDGEYQYEDAYNDINNVYNNPLLFYSSVEKGPFAGSIKNIKPLRNDKK